VLPDAKGALVVDSYFGTLRPFRRLVDGRRLLLLDYEGNTLWRGTSDCQAFWHADLGFGGPLTYYDGNDLVTLRPVHKD
jgi:hypothetical protein